MSVFDQLVNKVATFEGFRARAYQDAVGVWTVGYGSTVVDGHRVTAGATLTEPEARALLAATLQMLWRQISDQSEYPLDERAKSALTGFAHNLGLGALLGSTLWREHQRGNFAGAAGQFGRWNHAGGRVLRGLTNRRAWEAQMYRQGTGLSALG